MNPGRHRRRLPAWARAGASGPVDVVWTVARFVLLVGELVGEAAADVRASRWCRACRWWHRPVN